MVKGLLPRGGIFRPIRDFAVVRRSPPSRDSPSVPARGPWRPPDKPRSLALQDDARVWFALGRRRVAHSATGRSYLQ